MNTRHVYSVHFINVLPGTASRFGNFEKCGRVKRWQRRIWEKYGLSTEKFVSSCEISAGLPGLGWDVQQSGQRLRTRQPLSNSFGTSGRTNMQPFCTCKIATSFQDVSKMRALFSEEFFQRFHMAYRNYED